MSGKHWTAEEESAWRRFFAGGAIEAPTGRTVRAAFKRLHPEDAIDLADPTVAHKTSAAALRHLSHVPFRREGDPVRFVQDIQHALEKPWLAKTFAHDWPADVFNSAMSDARSALHG